MNSSESEERLVSSVVALGIMICSLPGGLFSVLVIADSVVDLKRLPYPYFVDLLGTAAVLGGIVSFLATPAALILTWINRRNLHRMPGVLGRLSVAVAGLGPILFVLKYASPIF